MLTSKRGWSVRNMNIDCSDTRNRSTLLAGTIARGWRGRQETKRGGQFSEAEYGGGGIKEGEADKNLGTDTREDGWARCAKRG